MPAPVAPAPLIIGPLRLDSNLVLAPMAGYTDLPFRLLCRENGADLCYSEMVSCHGLVYHQSRTFELLQTVAEERPVAIQLFGSDPALMGRAAAMVAERPVDLIDINMGCPVRKVIKKGAGAALMRNPELARAIIREVCRNSRLPVTVKFRSGWTRATLTAPQFAVMAEEAGAQAITIHGRTWDQGFGGTVDLESIRAVKQAVSIPVIGNGDVLTHADAQAMRRRTGCDGVMAGRGALGNPWLFSPDGRPATLAQRLPVIRRYLELAEQFLPLDKVLFKVKNHTAKFLSGLPGASGLRQALYACPTVAAMTEILEHHAQGEADGS